MEKSRQDAWSEDEDLFLAEVVLHHIREGSTQLEAFRQAAEGLDRTPAACGFRWNAEVRKEYSGEIEIARDHRKSSVEQQTAPSTVAEEDSINSAITLLEQLKAGIVEGEAEYEHSVVQELEKENKALRERLQWYEDAWREMEKLWQWASNACAE